MEFNCRVLVPNLLAALHFAASSGISITAQRRTAFKFVFTTAPALFGPACISWLGSLSIVCTEGSLPLHGTRAFCSPGHAPTATCHFRDQALRSYRYLRNLVD